jgi:hypothetical protein
MTIPNMDATCTTRKFRKQYLFTHGKVVLQKDLHCKIQLKTPISLKVHMPL